MDISLLTLRSWKLCAFLDRDRSMQQRTVQVTKSPLTRNREKFHRHPFLIFFAHQSGSLRTPSFCYAGAEMLSHYPSFEILYISFSLFGSKKDIRSVQAGGRDSGHAFTWWIIVGTTGHSCSSMCLWQAILCSILSADFKKPGVFRPLIDCNTFLASFKLTPEWMRDATYSSRMRRKNSMSRTRQNDAMVF